MRWNKNFYFHNYKYEILEHLISNGFIICGIYTYSPCLLQVENQILVHYDVLPIGNIDSLIEESISLYRELMFETIYVDKDNILSVQSSIDLSKLVLYDSEIPIL